MDANPIRHVTLTPTPMADRERGCQQQRAVHEYDAPAYGTSAWAATHGGALADASPVDLALRRQRETAESLEKRVAQLRSRLSAVLASGTEAGPIDPGPASMPASPLVGIIDGTTTLLDDVDAALARILERLTL